MRYLIDTSALVRFVVKHDPHQPLIVESARSLIAQGHSLWYTPQVARETWSVMTRPIAANGFGLTESNATKLMAGIRAGFAFADDVPGIFDQWLALVRSYGVSGKQVHDANHVAAMLTHGMSCVLTLDTRDFARYREIEIAELPH